MCDFWTSDLVRAADVRCCLCRARCSSSLCWTQRVCTLIFSSYICFWIISDKTKGSETFISWSVTETISALDSRVCVSFRRSLVCVGQNRFRSDSIETLGGIFQHYLIKKQSFPRSWESVLLEGFYILISGRTSRLITGGPVTIATAHLPEIKSCLTCVPEVRSGVRERCREIMNPKGMGAERTPPSTH